MSRTSGPHGISISHANRTQRLVERGSVRVGDPPKQWRVILDRWNIVVGGLWRGIAFESGTVVLPNASGHLDLIQLGGPVPHGPSNRAEVAVRQVIALLRAFLPRVHENAPAKRVVAVLIKRHRPRPRVLTGPIVEDGSVLCHPQLPVRTIPRCAVFHRSVRGVRYLVGESGVPGRVVPDGISSVRVVARAEPPCSRAAEAEEPIR